MSKNTVLRGAWLLASLCAVIVLAMGCQPRSDRYGLHELGVSPEKVYQIEPLELKKAEPNEAPPEPNVPPPEKIELSLEQSRAMALENNLELKAALIGPSIAGAQLNAEVAKFEASFFANLNATKVNQPSPNLQGEIAGSERESRGGDLGVQIPLRTGGSVTFDFSDEWSKTNALQTLFNPYWTSNASVSISQPLLRNAGSWANMYSIRIAAYNRDIVDTQTKLEVINILAALDRVYWRLYAARKEVEVRKQQYDLAQAQLDRARRLVEAGQRAPVEIIRAEAGVAEQLQAIITSENNLRDREREIKRIVHKAGLEMQTPTAVIPTTEPDPVRYDLDRTRLVRLAIENRMELLELQLQLLQDASTIEYGRNLALPLATLSYTYGVPGFGATQNDDLDMLVDRDFSTHVGRLQMTIPIGNEAAKSRLRQYIYTRRQRLATRANREDLIRQEVLNAVDQIEANWQRILAARQTTILNGRLYEAERRQFEEGLRTSTDVLDAQIRFANSQSDEILALADYQISLVDLSYATGTTLGAAKIVWEPIVPPTDVD